MLGVGVADRFGDRQVLLAGLGSTAAALAILAICAAPSASYVPGLPLLASLLLLVGLLGGSINGSSGRAVMAWFREGERGLAMSIRQTAVPAGGGIGALLLPPLAQSFGFAAVHALLAGLCALTAVFAWRWLRAPEEIASARPAPAAAARQPVAARRRRALRDPQVWRMATVIGVLCAPQLGIVTFGAVFLHDFAQASIITSSAALMIVQIGAGIARVWSSRWTDRNGNQRAYLRGSALASALLFAALAGMAALAAALPLQHEISHEILSHELVIGLIVTTLVVAGICVSAWHGVAYTELATLAGAERAGTALGLGNSCVFAVYFLTPTAIPALLSISTWPVVWLVASAVALIALPIFPRPAPLRRD